MNTTERRLYDYNTGDELGPATAEQVEASTRAAAKDGGVGAFSLDGRSVYTADGPQRPTSPGNVR